MKIEGKAAIVTGGGTGVGRATALQLAELGCSVLVNYSRSEEAAEKTAEEVRAFGVKGLAVRADVADDAACRDMVASAMSELGSLDVLVNNAGTTSFIAHHDLEAVKTEHWDDILAVNVRGVFQCARAAKGAMEQSGGGDVVNISSVASVVGIGSSIPYCASKAAVNNLTITLARVLAPKIRVNAIAPGFIEGSWLRDGMGEAYDIMKEVATSRSLLKTVCEPTDIAEAVVGLITGSDMVTGQCLICDAGLLLGAG